MRGVWVMPALARRSACTGPREAQGDITATLVVDAAARHGTIFSAREIYKKYIRGNIKLVQGRPEEQKPSFLLKQSLYDNKLQNKS